MDRKLILFLVTFLKELLQEASRGVVRATDKATVQVIGLASDDGVVASVTVNEIPAALSIPDTGELELLPGNTVKFSAEVTLEPGNNNLLRIPEQFGHPFRFNSATCKAEWAVS